MLKKMSAAAALALCLGIVPMFGQASIPPEGCYFAGGDGDGGYTATQAGGLAVGGDGVVTVTHADLTVDAYDNTAESFDSGAIVPGDVVTCSADAGFAVAGNPLP